MDYRKVCILFLVVLLLAGFTANVSAGKSCKCGKSYKGNCNKVTRVGFSLCTSCTQYCSKNYDGLLRCKWGKWKYGRCSV